MQAFINKHGQNTDRVEHQQMDMNEARQRVFLGQARVTDVKGHTHTWDFFSFD